jgi:hypothetical protein
LLKNPFLADVDYSGALMSFRPILKFNNYRNFALFDRLKLRSKFKFKEFVKQRYEGHYLKAQINNDLFNNSKSLKHSFIFKSQSSFDRNIKDPNFKKKEFLPLLSIINDEEDQLGGSFDFEPSIVYFFFRRKRFLKFLKLPESFSYEEKDSFLKLIDSDIITNANVNSIFFSWFNKFYSGLFLKRFFFIKTLKKKVFYFKNIPLKHTLNQFFFDLNKYFDLKNLFRIFLFSLYNSAFLRISPKTKMPVYRRKIF